MRYVLSSLGLWVVWICNVVLMLSLHGKQATTEAVVVEFTHESGLFCIKSEGLNRII